MALAVYLKILYVYINNCSGSTIFLFFHSLYLKRDLPWLIICIIIPHVNFEQTEWLIGQLTILNVTWQCLTAMKFVVEMGHWV